MKKILFISNSLGLGGSEKCMQEMINRMDFAQFNITVLALNAGTSFLTLDNRVHVINGYANFDEISMPWKMSVGHFLKKRNLSMLFRKTLFMLQTRLNFKHAHISKFFWQCFNDCIPPIEEHYDVVIGYGQNTPTYFLKDKVNADKKIAWLNTDLEKARYDLTFVKQFYKAADYIVTDAYSGKTRLEKIYPEFEDKIRVFPNILDVEHILEKGNEPVADFPDESVLKIVSVGRLCEAKAFHLAIKAAAILKQKNIAFKWFIVGGGDLYATLENQIQMLNLSDCVVLLGAKKNPYPYIKACDYYVQTSVYEGSCMTINEAMAFNKPIVCTNFPAAHEKIKHGENGLICEMNELSIAENLLRMIQDKAFSEKCSQYLKEHPIDYTKQLQMLSDLLK